MGFRLRMQRFQQDMDDLCQKQPGEVTGVPQEPLYYGMKLSQALNVGNQAEARHFLSGCCEHRQVIVVYG